LVGPLSIYEVTSRDTTALHETKTSAPIDMHFSTVLLAGTVAPMAGLAAPAMSVGHSIRGDNLCNQYKSPPQLCTPNATVSVEETALRAYKFYKAFVVDGDARTMFSLIDNVYTVCGEFHT